MDYGGGAIHALGRLVGVDIFGWEERAVESLWSRALDVFGFYLANSIAREGGAVRIRPG